MAHAAVAGPAAGAAAQAQTLQWSGSRKMIGVQLGAVSFLHEGVEAVLNNLQTLAGVNTLSRELYLWQGNRGAAGAWQPTSR
ncbi:MAG TPA: hypothetical protein VM120_03550 [Bryobacteraceae bacterium]|nr:hypothetical protein [Bryobacteraceae bacterium]